jgi:hypothetical protein
VTGYEWGQQTEDEVAPGTRERSHGGGSGRQMDLDIFEGQQPVSGMGGEKRRPARLIPRFQVWSEPGDQPCWSIYNKDIPSTLFILMDFPKIKTNLKTIEL